MTTGVFLAVLLAALLHATWNAFVKGGEDKHRAMFAVVMGHVPFSLAALAIFDLPLAQSWPWMAATIFFHVGYDLFLLSAYRVGDLSHVYPIARGTGPLVVAIVSMTWLGATLLPLEIAAIALIVAGLLSLALVRGRDGSRNAKAARLAVATGLFIAGYSIADGMGARASGSAVGFLAVASIIASFVFAGVSFVMRPDILRGWNGRDWRLGALGGGGSFVAYAIVVWAFTQAPIALVTALRETSVVFALLIGVLVFRERLDLAKVAATAVTLCGAVLLRLAR